MSPSPTSRTRRRSTSINNSAKKRRSTYQIDSSSDSEVVAISDSDSGVDEIPRKKLALIDLKKSPKQRRIISSSSSEIENESESEDICLVSPRRTSTTIISETDVSKNFLPTVELPAFLPVENIHYNWVFWRLYSEEIYSTYDKHLVKFDCEYLSRYLLGEIFHEKVNDEDADFDPSIFFQAVQITCVHEPFVVGNDRKRLVVDCEEVTTSTNSYMEAHMKRRQIIAQESLVDLLVSCLKIGDLLFVFGDIQIEESPFINLNSRYQHPILMAHYRHDGNFGPIIPGNKEFEDIMPPCLRSCFSHSVHHYDDNEYAIKVVPNTSPHDDCEGKKIKTPTKAFISPRRLTPKISEVVEVALGVLETHVSDHREEPNANSFPYGRVSNQDSDESSYLGIDIENEIEKHRILDSPGISTPNNHKAKATQPASEKLKSRNNSDQCKGSTEREQKQLKPLASAYGLKECSVRLKKLPIVSS